MYAIVGVKSEIFILHRTQVDPNLAARCHHNVMIDGSCACASTFKSTSHFRRGTVSSERHKTTFCGVWLAPQCPCWTPIICSVSHGIGTCTHSLPCGPLRPPDALNFHLRRNERIDVNCLCRANLLWHQVPFFPSDPMMNHPLLTMFQVTTGQTFRYS
jgi:hypothetical protein